MTCIKKRLFCLSLLVAIAAFTHGGEVAGASKILDPADKQVKKLAVTSSQIGYRSTLLFYTFNEQKAVLKVLIDNKNKDFPVTATVYTFADDVTDEGIGKWLNNQHSDGLFVDIPEPVAIDKVPADSCKALSHKLVGKEKQFFGMYDKFSVEIQLSGVPERNGVQIKDFKDTATVYVKTE